MSGELYSFPSEFSPHEAHSHSAFGWILPTLRTSEFTILQIVGLDAAVVSHTFVSSECHFTQVPAARLLQDILLPVLCVLHLCNGHFDAHQLEGMAHPHSLHRRLTFHRTT